MININELDPQGLIRQADGRISRFDAECILSHLLGVSKAALYLREEAIPNKIADEFNFMVEQRARQRPLQYIIGETEFMGLNFKVNPDVLIPRPETELLVEEAAKAAGSIKPQPTAKNPVNILDIGTGSGNIAISLTKRVTNCKIIASDVSQKALSVAKKNALLNDVSGRIEFILSDLFEGIPSVKFDIIVSNPPYVAYTQIDGLQKEISFEPRIALEAGPDGLNVFRRIIAEANRFLSDGGFLILELGFGQLNTVKELLERNSYSNIKEIKDYNYINRILSAEWIS